MESREPPRRIDLVDRELTESVIGAFYEVYNELRYGLLENLYTEALARELTKRGRRVDREVRVQIYYKCEVIGLQRIDMIVDERLVVEVKSTHDLSKASHRQVLSYLRGSHLQLALLLHFGPEAKFYRIISSMR
jgi:GxxExxY protein